MQPLRVLQVTPYYEEAWAYGGIPRVVSALARGLVRRGHAVTVCTTDVRDERSRLGPPAPAGQGGVEVRVFPNLSNRLAYRQQLYVPRGIAPYLRSSGAAFDVAHLHGCHHLPGAIAARELRRAGVPYFVTPNGTAPRIEQRRAAKWLFDHTLGRGMLAGAARVLAVSAAEARDLQALGVAAEALRVLPNPLDLDELEPPPARGELRARWDLGEAPIVLFLGMLTPRKGVDVLIDAFAALSLPGARLVLAGNDRGIGPALGARLRERGLTGAAICTGLLRGRERLAALADADVVAYPSRHEAFGLVPLEALLCGTPVVVADDHGCGEVIAEVGGGRRVPPGDAGALAAALRELLADPEAARREASEAAARVRARFGADVVSARLEQLYAEALAPTEASSTEEERSPVEPLSPVKARSMSAGNVIATTAASGVSFVLPVFDGEPLLSTVLDAILAEGVGRPCELIAVDDGSRDGSLAILQRYAQADSCLRVVAGPGRGSAAALNLGLREARYPIVCQVDQDVVLRPGWTTALVAALADPRVAAAQGWYETAVTGSLWARAMGLDLEQRYSRLRGDRLDHVCSGNTAYRASALRAVGGFDESLGYGYDNDLSYRLGRAGWQLAFCREAPAIHHWRAGLVGYLRQQYGVGYGRLDLVAKHPTRAGGDAVSGLRMILHAPAMLAALVAAGAAGFAALAGVPWVPPAALAGVLVGVLAADRLAAGGEAALRFRTLAGLAFVPAHLLRDVAWAAAVLVWTLRRFGGRPASPQDSMARAAAAARSGAGLVASAATDGVPRPRADFLVLVPARNEAANLPAVLAELRVTCPGRSVLVVDDASTDGTAELVARAGLPCLRLRLHLGVGGALRAGLRWARARGFQTVVRVDGDGQHPAAQIAQLIAPLLDGSADAAQGTRSLADGGYLPLPWVRFGQGLLARLVSRLARHRVTDPTSGFWAFGPAAVRLLGEHHPTGYPEPELLLFLHRNGLRVAGVPVVMRQRASGRTSLTLSRLAHAGWRVLLALLLVPLRAPVAAGER